MPAQLLIAGAAVLVIAGGAFTAGWRSAQNSRDSEELKIEQAAQKAGEAASDAAVSAIKNIEIKRVTIRQELEREIRTLPPVDTDCNLPDGLLNSINAALAPPTTGGDRVPGSNPTP